MKRVPVVATMLVGLAVVAMIALGVWQLQRRGEKEALLAIVAANQTRPPIAFPNIAQGDDLLFRRARALCLQPVSWHVLGGRNASGASGYRQIERCRSGAEGAGFAVQIGIGHTADTAPAWKGGEVEGYISHAPSTEPMIVAVFSHTPKTLMLVADPPLAGLDANPPADLSAIPNNHLAYAVQWFAFALIAAVIYVLALRKRLKSTG
ncbi:MAG: SURF1 family protein [Sphingomonas sp.]